jgi:hypothetical protein
VLALVLLVAVGVAFRQTRSPSENPGSQELQAESATAVTTMDSDPVSPAPDPPASTPDSRRRAEAPRFELTMNGSSSVFLHPDFWRPGGSPGAGEQRNRDPQVPRWAATGESIRIVVWDGSPVHQASAVLDLLAVNVAEGRWDEVVATDGLDLPPFVLEEAREAVSGASADYVYARGEGRYLFNHGTQWYELLLYLRDGVVVDLELLPHLNTRDSGADTDSDVLSAR